MTDLSGTRTRNVFQLLCCSSLLGVPDEMLNPKKKVWEKVQPDLHTDVNRVAMYKDDPFTVKGKGICTAPTLSNVNIK
jgi:aminoacyl tRNA synthase complex-interacting multifunctional protein 1